HPAKPLDCFGYRARDLIRRRDVAASNEHVAWLRAGHACRERVELTPVAREKRQPAPLLVESLGDCRADAAACAGDQCDLVSEPEIHAPVLRPVRARLASFGADEDLRSVSKS